VLPPQEGLWYNPSRAECPLRSDRDVNPEAVVPNFLLEEEARRSQILMSYVCRVSVIAE